MIMPGWIWEMSVPHHHAHMSHALPPKEPTPALAKTFVIQAAHRPPPGEGVRAAALVTAASEPLPRTEVFVLVAQDLLDFLASAAMRLASAAASWAATS